VIGNDFNIVPFDPIRYRFPIGGISPNFTYPNFLNFFFQAIFGEAGGRNA
jgi:hypothetical protein